MQQFHSVSDEIEHFTISYVMISVTYKKENAVFNPFILCFFVLILNLFQRQTLLSGATMKNETRNLKYLSVSSLFHLFWK